MLRILVILIVLEFLRAGIEARFSPWAIEQMASGTITIGHSSRILPHPITISYYKAALFAAPKPIIPPVEFSEEMLKF